MMYHLARPIIFGSLATLAYVIVVIVTTPALEPLESASAAVQANPIIMFGIGAGIGIQVYLSDRAKASGCAFNSGKTFGKSSGSTAATSFFSFFSLVPLGCCGWWLYLLSLLPSIVGTGVSAILIEYSQVLAYLGLAIVFGFNGLAAYRLYARGIRIRNV